MTAALPWRPRPAHPVLFAVDYQERQSRLKTIFRLFLAIPQLIVVSVLNALLVVLSIIAWVVILFTGRYPPGIHDLAVGLLRWSVQVTAFVALLRDQYPPFSTQPARYPLLLDIPYPERQSRWRLFARFVTIWPNQIVLQFVTYGWFFVTVFAWFAILIGRRYPPRLFGFAVGAMRWTARQQSYMYLLRDEYPPYRMASGAPPGNELVSGIIGAPVFAAYTLTYALLFGGFFNFSTETVNVTSPLTSESFALEQPSGEGAGVHITLLGYDDDVTVISDVKPGFRGVTFTFRAEKASFRPAIFSPAFLQVEDCYGYVFSVDDVREGSIFRFFFRGGSEEVTVLFQLPIGDEVCKLDYTFTGRIEFVFVGGR